MTTNRDRMDTSRANEAHSLKSFMTRLQTQGVISREEGLQFENKTDATDLQAGIFNLMKLKDEKVGLAIFILMRLWFKDERENSSPLTDMNTKPLQINTVVKCIFEYLGLRDLKNCRQVNKKWNFVAEPLLRKRSMIKFHAGTAQIGNFMETFRNCGTNVPFDTFSFKDGFSVSLLTEFFDKQRKTIKHLNFEWTDLINDLDLCIDSYNISEWTFGSPIHTLNITAYDNYTLLIVPLYQLSFIKILNLCYCRVDVKDGVKISPTEITLERVKFYKDGNKLDSIQLDDYIEVKKLKEIKFNEYTDEEYTSIRLNLNENCTIDKLKLTNCAETIDWSISNFSVKKLYLSTIEFLEKTDAKIGRLEFESSLIDLYALPLDIEEIVFGQEVSYVCTQPIVFPKLKYLCFDEFCFDNLQVVRNFANCNNLVAISLCKMYRGVDVTINLDWLPKSIRKLSLKEIPIVTGINALPLDALVLKNYCLIDAERILEKVSTNVLVLDWKKHYDANDNILHFLKKISCPKKVYVGPFIWSNNVISFKKSVLSIHVDKEAKFYLFENKRGRSIKAKDFERMSNISLHKLQR